MPQLQIFDFDSTIFKSPLPSSKIWSVSSLGHIISYLGWFHTAETLAYPYIPQTPDETWWDEKMFCTYREAREKGDICVLLTGRTKGVYIERVKQLCMDFGYDFDEFHLKDTTLSTLQYKLGVIQSLIDKYHPSKVHIYEDRVAHVIVFRKQFKEANVVEVRHSDAKYFNTDLEITLVEKLVKTFNSKSPKKIILEHDQPQYTSIHLTPESRQRIFETYHTKFPWLLKLGTEIILDSDHIDQINQKVKIHVNGALLQDKKFLCVSVSQITDEFGKTLYHDDNLNIVLYSNTSYPPNTPVSPSRKTDTNVELVLEGIVMKNNRICLQWEAPTKVETSAQLKMITQLLIERGFKGWQIGEGIAKVQGWIQCEGIEEFEKIREFIMALDNEIKTSD